MRSTGHVAVVTGATSGIGRFIALGLARAGHKLVLVCRNRNRSAAARAWIAESVGDCDIEVTIADLSRLSESERAARDIALRYPRINLLINNAGAFETTFVETAEGFDRVLAVNLLSPFVLTETLLPSLLAGAPSRIVNVGSSTSDRAKIDPAKLALGDSWTMVRAYSQSKLALMMTTFEWAERLAGTGVTVNVVHPGLVATNLVRSGGLVGLAWRCLSLAAMSEKQGAESVLHAALSSELETATGIYLKNRKPARPNPRALNPALRERVWTETARLSSHRDHAARVQAITPIA
jgi:NAD(P)-dependent dehydrogenase (short-subunit alcohol dehydrogenase family)